MVRSMNFKNILGIKASRRGRLSSILSHSSALRLLAVAALFFGVTGHCSTFVESSLISARDVASLRFPQVASERDEDDIVKQYAPYLQFVTQIGKEVDANSARQLVQVYTNLYKRSRHGAALFLKGLRYEMHQRVELSGWNPHTLSTNSPEMRRFVARYLTTWVREADEHLFRSYSNEIASRRAAE